MHPVTVPGATGHPSTGGPLVASLVFLRGAHTLLALTLEGAARYAGEWFSGSLWHEGFSDMSPANSALWLSLESFGRCSWSA